jgi:hypothetical protein
MAGRAEAQVGVADHAGWAVLVTVSGKKLVDRRRVELVAPGVPCMPHHHDAQGLPIDEAVALVARVARSAAECAGACLAQLASELPVRITGIAMRECPQMPPTVAERITSYWAQNRADWVMYREALAAAARERGWSVHWYDAKRVFAEAATALGQESIDRLLDETGAAVGPPWQKDHKMAMAAAIAASRAP